MENSAVDLAMTQSRTSSPSLPLATRMCIVAQRTYGYPLSRFAPTRKSARIISKFVVMDVGANDLVSVAAKADDILHRPVALKIAEDGGACRLYAGKKWVGIKIQ